MIEKLKNLGWKQFGGLVLIVIIIIAFGFGGFGGGFSTNNQNNIAKINKTNVTTQDFIDYVNQSGISQEAIRDNLDNNIIEELLSGLISTVDADVSAGSIVMDGSDANGTDENDSIILEDATETGDLVNAVGLVFILVVYSQGYLNKAIKSDVTNVVVLIIFIFLIGLTLASTKAFWISRELKLS